MKTRMQKALALLLALCLVGTAVCATTLLSFAEEETLAEVKGAMEVFPDDVKLNGIQWDLDDEFAFYEENGHLPLNDETRSINERLQAVRLEILRESATWRTLLEKENADLYGLLRADGVIKPPPPKKPPPFGNNATYGQGQERGKGYVKGQGALCF